MQYVHSRLQRVSNSQFYLRLIPLLYVLLPPGAMQMSLRHKWRLNAARKSVTDLFYRLFRENNMAAKVLMVLPFHVQRSLCRINYVVVYWMYCKRTAMLCRRVISRNSKIAAPWVTMSVYHFTQILSRTILISRHPSWKEFCSTNTQSSFICSEKIVFFHEFQF